MQQVRLFRSDTGYLHWPYVLSHHDAWMPDSSCLPYSPLLTPTYLARTRRASKKQRFRKLEVIKSDYESPSPIKAKWRPTFDISIDALDRESERRALAGVREIHRSKGSAVSFSAMPYFVSGE